MKKVYGDALKYRYTDSLLKIAESQLAEKKEQVRLLEDKDFEVTSNHKREVANLEGQVATLKEQVTGFEKMYKRERFKRKLSQGLGVLATTAAIVLPLIIKK
jgi:hypothetical protein